MTKIDKYLKKNALKNKLQEKLVPTSKSSNETLPKASNLQQNPDLNLMDASFYLEDIVSAVMKEEHELKSSVPESGQGKENIRFDMLGVRIIKT